MIKALLIIFKLGIMRVLPTKILKKHINLIYYIWYIKTAKQKENNINRQTKFCTEENGSQAYPNL